MPIPTVASVVKWLGQAEILGLVAGCFVFGVKGILYIWRRFGRKGLVLFFALSWVLRRRLFQTTSEIVVRFLQWHLNTFWALVSLRIFAIQLSSIANDQKPVLDYVAGMRTRYGPRHAELVTVLEPSTTHELRDRMTGPIRDVPFKFSLDEWGLAETPLHMLNPPPPSDLFRPSSTVHLSCNRLGSTSKIGSPIPILYIHGGGFVAANAAVLMQSVTPLVREGFTVYCIDYPLAPDNRFPIPVISVLRAMFWMRHYREIDRILVYGDSAGAALATMATALACNPPLLAALLAEVRRAGPSEDILDSAQWGDSRSLPRIERVLSVYGLLDRFSWRSEDLPTISPLENALAREGVKFCFDAFVNNEESYFNGRCCFASMLVDEGNGVASSYPPLLLLCGTKDPLLASSRRVLSIMNSVGLRCLLKEYKARHAFLGFPDRKSVV